ncbi:MAG: hypothetical protein CM15mP25_1050 [Gammaproteobacteria bacterium]|nr:MAG: hypothetical protein CM15mP25_1050 [Gammaproteobacteria bacterium]
MISMWSSKISAPISVTPGDMLTWFWAAASGDKMPRLLLRTLSPSRVYSVCFCGVGPQATEGAEKRRDYSEVAEKYMDKNAPSASGAYVQRAAL